MTDRELWVQVFTACLSPTAYLDEPPDIQAMLREEAKSLADYAVEAAPEDDCGSDVDVTCLTGETFFVATTTKEN